MAVASDKIHIFPCVSRNDSKLNSRLMSEENITNIIKSVTDRSSFVISRDTNTIEFILDGYYIKLDTSEEPLPLPLFVSINMQETNNEHKLIKGDELKDSNSEFEGILLSNAPGPGTLQLLDALGNVPKESFMKFNRESIISSVLDFGELN